MLSRLQMHPVSCVYVCLSRTCDVYWTWLIFPGVEELRLGWPCCISGGQVIAALFLSSRVLLGKNEISLQLRLSGIVYECISIFWIDLFLEHGDHDTFTWMLATLGVIFFFFLVLAWTFKVLPFPVQSFEPFTSLYLCGCRDHKVSREKNACNSSFYSPAVIPSL